jgi:hypothetical protein
MQEYAQKQGHKKHRQPNRFKGSKSFILSMPENIEENQAKGPVQKNGYA